MYEEKKQTPLIMLVAAVYEQKNALLRIAVKVMAVLLIISIIANIFIVYQFVQELETLTEVAITETMVNNEDR